MNTRRSMVLGATAALFFGVPRAFAQAPAPAPGLRSIAVLRVELLDEQDNPATKAAQEVRLRDALLQLREELRAHGLYRVVDAAVHGDVDTEGQKSHDVLRQSSRSYCPYPGFTERFSAMSRTR